MSRRFGRNQKRRMRAEIQKLEVAHEIDRGLLRWQTARLRERDDVIEYARGVLCAYSAALPPGSMGFSGPARESIRLPEYTAARIFDPNAPVLEALKIEQLYVMLAKIEHDPREFGRHVLIEFGDKQWGYAVSDMAWHSIPEDVLIQNISRSLALMITRALRAPDAPLPAR